MNDFDKSAVFQNIGLCYLHLKEYEKGHAFLFQSLEIQKESEDTNKIVSSYMNIANLYYDQYLDDNAIPYFDSAYRLSKKTTDFELKQNASFNMSIIEENKKNYARALIYRKEYETWRDSLNNENKVWELAQAEKEYAEKQNQKQIEVLTFENELKKWQQNILLTASAILIIFIIIGIYFFRQKTKSNRQK